MRNQSFILLVSDSNEGGYCLLDDEQSGGRIDTRSYANHIYLLLHGDKVRWALPCLHNQAPGSSYMDLYRYNRLFHLGHTIIPKIGTI